MRSIMPAAHQGVPSGLATSIRFAIRLGGTEGQSHNLCWGE